MASARISEQTARELVRWLRPEPKAEEPSLPHEYVTRLLELRKQRLIGIVFAEEGRYYISNDPADPWNTKEFIQIPVLMRLIEYLEAERDRAPEAMAS
jgi:hypothetical protein